MSDMFQIFKSVNSLGYQGLFLILGYFLPGRSIVNVTELYYEKSTHGIYIDTQLCYNVTIHRISQLLLINPSLQMVY